MTLSENKSMYFNRLRTLYSIQEIESIFALIVRQVLNYSKIEIHQKRDDKIRGSEEKKMLVLLDRLSIGEPVQYVLGETEFYGLVLKTDRRALIPRPETEYLVDLVFEDLPKNKPLKIIDLCTGNGCIAIALAKNLPLVKVTAMDISTSSIELARINASDNHVHIDFFVDDILNPLSSYEKYDYIISNPPYVCESEKKFMHKNIIDYEPPVALFVSDPDPLIFFRAIAEFGVKYLNAGGTLFVEINENLGKETANLFNNPHYKDVFILKDINNKDRFVKARKR
jgi:release factor glutamine methyltransferase